MLQKAHQELNLIHFCRKPTGAKEHLNIRSRHCRYHGSKTCPMIRGGIKPGFVMIGCNSRLRSEIHLLFPKITVPFVPKSFRSEVLIPLKIKTATIPSNVKPEYRLCAFYKCFLMNAQKIMTEACSRKHCRYLRCRSLPITINNCSSIAL